MAETLAVRPAIHRQVLAAFLVRIVFLPKRSGAQFKHAAPVIFHFLQHITLLAKRTQCFQLIKAHIRGCYLRHRVVQQYLLLYTLLLRITEPVEKDREHISIARYVLGSNAIYPAVYQRLFAFIPVCFKHLVF